MLTPYLGEEGTSVWGSKFKEGNEGFIRNSVLKPENSEKIICGAGKPGAGHQSLSRPRRASMGQGIPV